MTNGTLLNKRLLLVDDHTIVREGLKRILDGSGEGWVIAEAGSGFQAFEILRQNAFALAVVDLSMPGLNGLDLIHRIKADFPEVAVLVLSMHAEEQYAIRSFKAGANGYVTKDSDTPIMVEGVRILAAGGRFIAPAMAQAMALHLSSARDVLPHESLSDREMEIFRRIVKGQSVNAIADSLSISNKTVSTHKARVLEKMGMDSTADLVRYSVAHNLTP